MLLRISLIIAIIAGLAVAALNFTKIKDQITHLRADLATQTTRADTAEKNLAKTTKDLSATKAELATTKQSLDTMTALKETAEKEAAEKVKLAAQATEALKGVQEQLSNAQAKLAAYDASGLSPEQALVAAKTIKGLQDTVEALNEEKTVLARKLRKTEIELARYIQPEKPVPLPPTLAGKVMVSDPKWDFVVLNFGEDQGAIKDGELLVNRAGQLVAKIKITSVEKNRCIANVVPGWKLGELMEGDLVFPAYPAS